MLEKPNEESEPGARPGTRSFCAAVSHLFSWGKRELVSRVRYDMLKF